MRFLFINIAKFSIVIPVIIGFIHFKKLNKPFKIFYFYILFGVLGEITASLLKTYLGNNLPGLHVYTFFEFAFLISFYFFDFYKTFPVKKYILTVFVFLIIVLLDAFYINSIYEFNTLASSVLNIIMVLFSVLFFYRSLNNVSEKSIFKNPMFWISATVLFYYSTRFVWYLMSNYLIENYLEIAQISNVFHALINIISKITYAYAFIVFSKEK